MKRTVCFHAGYMVWVVQFTKNIQGLKYYSSNVVETEEEAYNPYYEEKAAYAFRRAEQRDFCSWGWAG